MAPLSFALGHELGRAPEHALGFVVGHAATEELLFARAAHQLLPAPPPPDEPPPKLDDDDDDELQPLDDE